MLCLSPRSLAAIWLVLFLTAHKSLADCPYQPCTCSGSIISCQHIGMDQIPPLLPATDSFTTLRIFDNNIQDVADGSLPANLTEIDFSNNPLTTISAGAFNDSALTLETLSFTSAQFTDLPDALLSLTTLRSLTIKNTHLLNWNLDIIKHLGATLQTLVLNNVGLTTWPSWFPYLPQIVTIRFSNDPLTSIPDDAFDLHLDKLTTLVITNANLSRIPTGASSMTALQSLDLSDNDIENIENLPTTAKLTSLYLLNNKISDVMKLVYGMTPYSDSLNYFYADGNMLTEIPRLTHMTELLVVSLRRNLISDAASGAFPATVTTLELSDNDLSSVPNVVSYMAGLTRLFLNGNSIQQIQASDIPAKLIFLDLQSNLIHDIDDVSFPANSSLKTLRLAENPISSISPVAFDSLAALQELDLQDTRLTRVPLALSSLTSLTKLDLDNCPDLVCTCDESSLLTWFQSRGDQLSVEGACGVIDVAEFFDNLAPQCP